MASGEREIPIPGSATRLDRRGFLSLLAAGSAAGFLPAAAAANPLITPKFVFARLEYSGGDWFTDMKGKGLAGSAEIQFLKRLVRSTMIEAEVREFSLSPGEPTIGNYPFLYITGHEGIRMSGTQMDRLRQAIIGGATLFAEGCAGNSHFRDALVPILDQILPEGKLEILPMEHPLFHCLYEIPRIEGGDKLVHEYMEGVTIGDRLAVIYSDNDLGCAWEGHPCKPGGEPQREHAFRMGMNIVAYAMTH